VPGLEFFVGLEAVVGRAAVDVAAVKALLVRLRTCLDAEQRRRLAEDPEYRAVVAEDERARELEARTVRYWSQHGGEPERRAHEAHWRRLEQDPAYRAWHLWMLDSQAEQARLRENARALVSSWSFAGGEQARLASEQARLSSAQLNSTQHAFREHVWKLKSYLSIRGDAPIPRCLPKLTIARMITLVKKYAEAYPRGPPFPLDPRTNMIHL
jgi:hypothetical protein